MRFRSVARPCSRSQGKRCDVRFTPESDIANGNWCPLYAEAEISLIDGWSTEVELDWQPRLWVWSGGGSTKPLEQDRRQNGRRLQIRAAACRLPSPDRRIQGRQSDAGRQADRRGEHATRISGCRRARTGRSSAAWWNRWSSPANSRAGSHRRGSASIISPAISNTWRWRRRSRSSLRAQRGEAKQIASSKVACNDEFTKRSFQAVRGGRDQPLMEAPFRGESAVTNSRCEWMSQAVVECTECAAAAAAFLKGVNNADTLSVAP